MGKNVGQISSSNSFRIILAHHVKIFPLAPIVFSFLSVLTCCWLAKDAAKNIQCNTRAKFNFGGNNFIFFIFLNILTFIGYAQFYDVFPVYAMPGMGEQTIGILFIISSVVIVLAQMPVSKLIAKFPPGKSIFLSNLMLAIGTLLFIPASDNGFIICALGVIFISLAEVIYAPLYQALAIKLFEPKNPVLSLAVQSFSWGIAEAIATFFGVYASGHGNGHISIVLGALAALIVSGICFIKLPRIVINQA